MKFSPIFSAGSFRHARHLLCVVLSAWLLTGLTSCGNGDTPAVKSERNPFLRRAKEKAQEKDYPGAIQLYKRALEDDASLARAHLELGILYDETKEYVSAIYHYGNYLEQGAPIDADQRKWLEDCIRHAKYSFVADMPVNPGARKKIEELSLQVEELKGQNAKLLVFAKQMQKQLGQAAPALPDITPKPAVPIKGTLVELPPDPVRPTEYKVVAGDTLSKVSQKVYGNQNQWMKIQEANDLPANARLKVDQVLKIPR